MMRVMTEGVCRLSMPTALVHDRMVGFHGSERVVDVIRADVFAPGHEPDIFTFHADGDRLPSELAARIAGQSRLAGSRAFSHGGRWRYLLPLMPLYFRRLDLEGYDLVLSSSHSFAFYVRPPEGAKHVCYCHTPMYYAWMPRTEGDRMRGLPGALLSRSRRLLQRMDRHEAQGPDHFIANSRVVRDRIRRFYRRDAEVIHPPVDVDDFDAGRSKDPGHFLWVHRLVPHKRPEVVIEAFRELPYRLTMVGTGMLEPAIRESLPPNVTLRGGLSRGELVELFETAAGFVHIGVEDFGISMVEALAAGTPVIARRAGGALDIVRDGRDGILVDDADPGQVRRAVHEVAGRTWEPGELAARAKHFSRESFAHRLLDYLEGIGVA